MKHLPVKIIEENGTETRKIHTNPDPYMIRWRDGYYCYSSGELGIKVLFSKDMERFTEHNYAYQNDREYSYWAPSVFEWEGLFYLYYSSLKDGEADDHLHFLRVAVSDHPLGPFKYTATLTDYFSIDPHVIKKDRRIYIYYAANIQNNESNGRIGTTIWMDELLTPMKLAGKGQLVLLPSIDQEIFARNRFGDGKDWHTLEGPYYLSDGETSWLMYSGNAFTSSDYFVGYAMGKTTDNLCDMFLKKYPSDNEFRPLVKVQNGIKGPGHNSITQAPDHITPIIVYHGREQRGKNKAVEDDRELYIDYIWREDELLKTKAPSGDGIDKLPHPDICYIQQKPFCNMEKDQDGVVCVTDDYKILLPVKEAFYIEVCVRPTKGSISVYTEDHNETLIVIEGNYWQRVGFLYDLQSVKVRHGEEWHRTIFCQRSSHLSFRMDGDAMFQYLDCTFLQAGGGKPLSCLL